MIQEKVKGKKEVGIGVRGWGDGVMGVRGDGVMGVRGEMGRWGEKSCLLTPDS
jgi:hypothetical protein